MSYLYISESGTTLSIDGGYFVAVHKDGMLHKIPKETLESVALFGNINITTPCMQELLRRGIPVSYFSSKGAYFGRLESTSNKDIKRLKKQIYLTDNEEFSLEFSKKIISAKINNQMIVLKRYGKNKIEDISNEIKQLKLAINKIKNTTKYEELIGYEGVSAKNYFAALSRIVNKDFAFNGRNRMPPKDPFNSMLSLGYTLLMYELFGEIENRGLTPYSGFLHRDRERHPTLASDLMEEWRAVLIDSVVLSLVQGNEISKEHFIKDEETKGVYLTNEGMKIFLKKYENKLRMEIRYIDNQIMSYRRCLWYQINELTKMISENDIDIYKPIYIR